MKMNNYDIAAKAEKGRKKDRGERNGDCCSWIEENGCVVLALADGVGHCANDYEAAQTSCSQFIDKCRKALQNGDRLDETTLRRFCEEIDPVLARKNEMACFCAIVWKPEENESVWFHVGDTRIYRYSYREGMCQLTKDDHGTPIAVKMNGKVHTDHGSVVTATPISSAIGDMKRKFHTGRCDFLPSESLILCSDGMYGTANFAQVVRELLSKVDMEEAASDEVVAEVLRLLGVEDHVAVAGHVEEGVVEYLAAAHINHGVVGGEVHLCIGVAVGYEVGE
jgi:serine/threonine protein phosphatase PrpC